MKQRLILFDGPKGAGKTTIRKLLTVRLPSVVFLNLDRIRVQIQRPNESIPDANARATEVLSKEIAVALDAGQTVFVDSGLTENRLRTLEAIGRERSIPILKYQLIAPVEILLDRVRTRDAEKGKPTNEARFKETYTLQQAKSTDGFTVFDTSILSAEEVAESIAKDIASLD